MSIVSIVYIVCPGTHKISYVEANANAEIRLRALETVGQSGRRVDAHGVPQDGGMMRDYADRAPADTGGAAGAMPARHER